MKKIILLLLTLVACAAVSMAAADDLKDNSLQIDNSRLEREEELSFGVQSEQIKDLFNESTRQKLQEIQHYQDEQLITERGQLFSAIQGPTDIYHSKELFQPGTEKLSKLQTSLKSEDESSWDDFLPGVVYFVAAILLVSMTVFVSYRISKGEV